jgi:hypothetical protein
VRRVPTASRRLLLLAFAVAFLAVPSGAAGAPAITFDHHIIGTAGTSPWYVSNVQVYWTFDPPPSQTQGCDAVTITSEGTTDLDCIAWWGLTRIEDPLTIYIDKTPPAVTGHPSRPPDANGWYNKPVTIMFSGTDATSGVAGCSGLVYAGPDSGNASVAGTCTDNAANVGRANFGFAYYSTPPTLGKVTTKHGNRSLLLTWTVSPDTQVTQITRSGGGAPAKVVYRGTGQAFRDKGLRPGAKYLYTVTAFDQASNADAEALPVTGTNALINPVPGQRVTAPPRLAWLPVKGASY